MNFNLETVIIEPLGNYPRGVFSCGHTTIDNFFRNNAKKDHEKYKVRVFVAKRPETEAVLGFYSLTLKVLEPDHVSEEAAEKFGRIKAVPAVYLAMIGVDRSLQGGGIGFRLMIDAFDKALAIAELAGTYALTLDAVDHNVADKYGRYGFKPFKEGELRMFIPLQDMRNALDAG